MTVTSLPSKNNHHQKIADELAHLLADTYTLYLKTQNYHWNVTGPNFHSLHLMFETQYTELAAAVDVLAERIRSLKCKTPASFAQFLKLTSLKEESGVSTSKDMLKQLLRDHQAVINHAYAILAKASKFQDEATADLLVERIREHETTTWMLRSSLE